MDPRLGRFISVDPPMVKGSYLPTGNKEKDAALPGMGGIFNPINIDTYRYASNNPLKIVDPDGNEDIVVVQVPGKTGRLESKAFVFPDGTLSALRVELLKLDYKVFGNILSLETIISANLGSNFKVCDNFTSLPDDTTRFGTTAAGIIYNYKRDNFNGMNAYLLEDPSLGVGSRKVPQDPNYGDSQIGMGKNPAYPQRNPAYVEGSHFHPSDANGNGSTACVIQKGFNGDDGLNTTLESSTTGQKGRAVILREK